MAREIDFTKRLSEDDLSYLAQRPWIAEEADRQGHRGVARQVERFARGDKTVARPARPARPEQPVLPTPPDVRAVMDADEPEEPEEPEAVTSGELETEEPEESEDYQSWTVQELKNELSARSVSFPRSANKYDLIELLQEDDGEDEEAV